MAKSRNFQHLESVPEEGIERVGQILRSGNLFRYSGDPSESEVMLFERDFLKDWGGDMRFALAVNSCTNALFMMLHGLDVRPGDEVLAPAFTFTAVPSAIVNSGAVPVLVECGMDFKVDLDDLEKKMNSHPDAKIFLLSHMRGYISDMDAVIALCDRYGVVLLEDAAHALGSCWDGQLVGTFGKASCYSFQSYKIINAGEGGMVVTDDEELFVKMVYDQGAYEGLYEKHFVESPFFGEFLNRRPLFNMRMSNVTAAIARSQLPHIGERVRRYREVYDVVAEGLRACEYVEFPETDAREERVFDSIQFRLKGFTADMMEVFIFHVKSCGVPLAAFSTENNARAPWNWKFVSTPGSFFKTHAALDTACDMRITTLMSEDDCSYLVQSILDGIHKAVTMPVI